MKNMFRRVLCCMMVVCMSMGLMSCAEESGNEEPKATVTPTPTEAGDNGQEDGSDNPGDKEDNGGEVDTVQNSVELLTKWGDAFAGATLSTTLKQVGYGNPIMTQRLGADPYVIEYDGRVYVYMTGDVPEYNADGTVKENSYSKINTLCVLSSADLVNWTDHGTIYAAGKNGAANWGNNSWAPAVCCKEIDGKMKFFIYFANGANGIGVLTSDSPTGPFVDPIDEALISRKTPNCDTVSWLFDPAVLIDDDGSAYLYFGGGIPNEQYAHPNTARVVKLGADMISLDGEPVMIDAPYIFEDSGINKIGDTYYYSYCTNWHVDDEGKKEYGFENAQIVYMTSDNPMGPFSNPKAILKNPGTYFGVYGNNHHCVFTFKDQYYIAYHSQILEAGMGLSGGYRITHIDKVTVNADGSIAMGEGTKLGVPQVQPLNPYEKVEAGTIWTMGGINTTQYGSQALCFGSGNMLVTDISDGDWLAVSGVDFGDEGASSFTADLVLSEGATGAILVRLDNLENGTDVGVLEITGEAGEVSLTTKLAETVTGKHNVFFIFMGENYQWDKWNMNK